MSWSTLYLLKRSQFAVLGFLGAVNMVVAYFIYGTDEIRQRPFTARSNDSIGELSFQGNWVGSFNGPRKGSAPSGWCIATSVIEIYYGNPQLRRILITDFHDVALTPGLKGTQSRRERRPSMSHRVRNECTFGWFWHRCRCYQIKHSRIYTVEVSAWSSLWAPRIIRSILRTYTRPTTVTRCGLCRLCFLPQGDSLGRML